MSQGPVDPPGDMLRIPRPMPRPCPSLKLFDDVRRDAGINIAAAGRVVVAHLSVSLS